MLRRPAFRFTAVAVLAVSACFSFALPADAEGKPARVTLSCTDGVANAVATVELHGTLTGPATSAPLTVTCADGTVTLKGISPRVGYVSYAVGSSCGDVSARPLTVDCTPGVRLTVR